MDLPRPVQLERFVWPADVRPSNVITLGVDVVEGRRGPSILQASTLPACCDLIILEDSLVSRPCGETGKKNTKRKTCHATNTLIEQ